MPPSPLTNDGIEYNDKGGGRHGKRGGADNNDKQQEWSVDNAES
jgi:hypothetical protein